MNKLECELAKWKMFETVKKEAQILLKICTRPHENGNCEYLLDSFKYKGKFYCACKKGK
jgi:hypothetical protein